MPNRAALWIWAEQIMGVWEITCEFAVLQFLQLVLLVTLVSCHLLWYCPAQSSELRELKAGGAASRAKAVSRICEPRPALRAKHSNCAWLRHKWHRRI